MVMMLKYAKDQNSMSERKRDGVECLIKGVLVAKILFYREIVVRAGALNTKWVYNLINMVIILY